jgi:hypothetical protein
MQTPETRALLTRHQKATLTVHVAITKLSKARRCKRIGAWNTASMTGQVILYRTANANVAPMCYVVLSLFEFCR